MPTRPIFGCEFAGHPWSGPIADDPLPGRTKTAAGQRDQTANGTGDQKPTTSLPAQAFNTLLAADLNDLGWRQQPCLNPPFHPYARPGGTAPSPDDWRDPLLAEIEDLAGELKRQVARFALFCAVQQPDEASDQTNAAAVAWMQETLDDVSATALGMEMACREALLRANQAELLRASQAKKQDLR